jgi:hypothetical protein
MAKYLELDRKGQRTVLERASEELGEIQSTRVASDTTTINMYEEKTATLFKELIEEFQDKHEMDPEVAFEAAAYLFELTVLTCRFMSRCSKFANNDEKQQVRELLQKHTELYLKEQEEGK